MYKDVYELPKLRADITFPKVVVILITLLISFVIPAHLIQQEKNKQARVEMAVGITEEGGRVAGETTQRNSEITIPILNLTVNLNSQTGLLIILGMVLVGISVILFIYLIIDNLRDNLGKTHY